MNSHPIGLLHISAATLALLFGASQLLRSKGTQMHKALGYCYAVSMFVTVVTAFCIYRLYGHFGPFHVAAIVSFVTLLVGLVPAMLRRPRGSWLVWHYKYMSWSYVGLLGATVAEAAVRIPKAPSLTFFVVGCAVVFSLGGWLIRRLKERTVAKVQHLAKA
jgi:uncharacterized membrane protein